MVRWRRLAPGLLGLTLVLLLASELCVRLIPLPARLAVGDSPILLYRDGTVGHVLLADDDRWRIRRDLSEVDPNYLRALLRFEDKRFRYHLGVDPFAIARALISNLRAGRVVSGGSTLTMQLVRMVEPRPRRLRSKLVEAFRAYQLERFLTKDQILQNYLRFLPFGGNLEGVEAASRGLFGHGANTLSPDEIALLLAIPRRPSVLRASEARAARILRARDEVLKRLNALGLWTDQELATAQALPVPTAFKAMPNELPHTVRWLRAQRPSQERLETTLDRGVQSAARAILQGRGEELGQLGVHNGAVVVADRASGELRALVGNLDFWDGLNGGQIIAYDEPRSVGSTLKPLIYAQALQKGRVLPETMILDLPRDYSGYRPGNYDGRFEGLISMEEALAQSRNLPFVDLLADLGVDAFLGMLVKAGAGVLARRPDGHGLSAAIGAVELSPLELTGIYGMLASGGGYRPLVWEEREAMEKPRRVLPPGPVWLTARALSRRDRPDAAAAQHLSRLRPTVRWKTGTSYGYKDAWTAGWTRHYVITVWLGNLDQVGSRQLVGAGLAAPLFFDLAETLESGPILEDRPDAPHDLSKVSVCQYSGHLPGPACRERREVWAVTKAVPTKPCPYHVEVDVDLDSGEALNASCRAERRWERRSMLRWPASLRRFLHSDFGSLPRIPPLASDCQGSGAANSGLRILSPTPDPILLIPGLSLEVQEVPLLAEAPDGRSVSWFVDGVFLGKVRADQKLWWKPSPGKHRIVLQGAGGQRRALNLRVDDLGLAP